LRRAPRSPETCAHCRESNKCDGTQTEIKSLGVKRDDKRENRSNVRGSKRKKIRTERKNRVKGGNREE
jgi:hypothetical protein